MTNTQVAYRWIRALEKQYRISKDYEVKVSVSSTCNIIRECHGEIEKSLHCYCTSWLNQREAASSKTGLCRSSRDLPLHSSSEQDHLI